jgi:hypothetical protein
VADLRLQVLTPSFSFQAPNLIDIGEVCGELNRNPNLGGLGAVVFDVQLLVANSVPQELLQPEMQGNDHCPLDLWFGEGYHFLARLTSGARSLGVSRDVLLVRLAKSRVLASSSNFVLIVGLSSGTVSNRGQRVHRVTSALLPTFVEAQIYPGISLETLGTEMALFAHKAMGAEGRFSRELRTTIRVGQDLMTLAGWWSPLGSERLILWGRFE